MEVSQNEIEQKEFGFRIKELRRDLKLTQGEFGKKIGLTQNTITKYENGLRNPSNQIVLSICREYGVNELWLRDGIGEMFTRLDKLESLTLWFSRSIRSDSDEPFIVEFLEMLSNLDHDEWKLMEGMFRKIKKSD